MNLITYLPCAHDRHGGGERRITRNCNSVVTTFSRFWWKLCNSVECISYKCELFICCYMCFLFKL